MRLHGLGLVCFAVALVGLGVVSLVSGDFAYVWQPVPTWLAGSSVPAYLSGALVLAVGVGLPWRRTVVPSAVVLIIGGIASMLAVHVPRLVKTPLEEGEWFNLGEIATMVAGAWILLAQASRPAGERGVRIARVLFALALPTFGLSHFVYAQVTAKAVPAWLPAHLGWAYLTGAGHIAAGLAILVGVLPRLASRLEALMVSTFVLAVNVPELIRTPTGKWQWTELFVATAIAGVAFLVAGSYRARSGGAPS